MSIKTSRTAQTDSAETLLGQDAAVFCLGTYTSSVSDADLRRITVDYTIAFARVLQASSPGAALSHSRSGSGADRTERSRVPFALYKGQAENALLAAGFPRVYIFRPAYILSRRSRGRNRNFSLLPLARESIPLFRLLFPNQVIRADDLARVMVDVTVRGTDESRGPVFENRDIRAMFESL